MEQHIYRKKIIKSIDINILPIVENSAHVLLKSLIQSHFSFSNQFSLCHIMFILIKWFE